MSRPPKELSDLDKQFEKVLIAVRDLDTRAHELGVSDISKAARIAHDALLDCKLGRMSADKSS